ncbi:KilA-N domain-containing protein [Aeromonas rivipollensis]|uniref:KilA-N domain-containing protein n=1 Tax=Aeromonas rivipollensis TaxID=948519 RepID=UPI001F43326D|nr:KilA-N domain-containing protein [Aeromonas rivipollensis]MCE9942658.1 KilA-N domain-containing protein [Aeromonas rivipollensis]
MKITFNGNTYPIRKNAEGLYSLTDIDKAYSHAMRTEKGTLNHWKKKDEINQMVEMGEIRVIAKRGQHTGGTWGCKEAVIEYASYCSNEFRRAVRKAFIALTEGNAMQAAAIAESVAVSPELLEKHDMARDTMNAAIHACWPSASQYTYANFYRLACKAATGYVPSVLTGKNGSAKNYIAAAENPSCMAALIAAMETVTVGLKVGLDYHKVAALLGVETTKNIDYLLLDKAEKAA